MIDEILQRLNLKYEDLNSEERETLYSWMDALQKNRVTVGNIKKYIKGMKESVENELTKAKIGSKQDLFLKARLRNYLLLEAFLSTPEKAQEAIEKMLSGVASRK